MKHYLFLIVACLGAYSVNAQYVNYLYLDGSTHTADGVTLVVEDVNRLFFAVQNAENELASQNPVDADGNEVSPFDIYGGKIDRQTIKAAFDATFTEDEAATLREKDVRIRLFLTSDNTGKVLEVVFLIYRNAGANIISPAKFVAFEKNLKAMVRWAELSEDEKRLAFTHTTIPLKMSQLAPIRKINDGVQLPDSLVIVQ